MGSFSQAFHLQCLDMMKRRMGLTMLQNDDMDFFVETCADEACTKYKSPSASKFENVLNVST